MKKLLLPFLFLVGLNSNAQNTAPFWSLAGNNNAGTAKLGTTNGVHLRLYTNNNERMRLTAQGFVGIGTANPTARLQINSAASQDPLRILVNNSTKLLGHRNGGLSVGLNTTPPANGLFVQGKVNIGTTLFSPVNKLQVANDSSLGVGIYTSGQASGLWAEASQAFGTAVMGSGRTGVEGRGAQEIGSFGVVGESGFIGVVGNGDLYGVMGISEEGNGVAGFSDNSYGGWFLSTSGNGLYASTEEGQYAAVFEGDIFLSNSFAASDGNLKKNVQPIGSALTLLNKLKPVQYEFREDGKYALLRLPEGSHYGLVAQDVEKAFPDLVKEAPLYLKETSNGSKWLAADGKINKNIQGEDIRKESITLKGVNYTELIPLLIKAVQEQQQNMEEQQKTISLLSERVAQLEASPGKGNQNSSGANISDIRLEQNHPNPVDQTTTFRYRIPPGALAQIHVYEANSGKLLKTVPAPTEGKMQMNTSDLPAGNYIYTLTVNGKMAGSKHMMVTR